MLLRILSLNIAIILGIAANGYDIASYYILFLVQVIIPIIQISTPNLKLAVDIPLFLLPIDSIGSEGILLL